MTNLTDALHNAQRYVVYEGDGEIPNDVFDVLRLLVGDVEAAKEGLQNLRELMAVRPVDVALMSRADALKAARDHVEAMSTNARGYQDGVTLSDKVAAVDRFARFLMGEGE
ncbi:hypothetical protein [Streptomyces sp. NPDC048603]|uniref:hypothetical protein n=1 Tax=Streptomyces sp. NPDC048603 TaxID=3365577 RepID=UPI00371CA6D6